jgi:glycosyltransferase involved in cell wall biosynthesis
MPPTWCARCAWSSAMADESAIDLTLLVPCFNEAAHLRRCVATVLETLENLNYRYEVIFIDDASADATRDILEEICAAQPRCRLIACDRNGGRGAAVKRGFAAARGRIVGFIDIDLEIGAHYIAAMVHPIDRGEADCTVALRTNELSSVRAVVRAFISRTYQVIQQLALGLGIRDTESGCKFFDRAKAAAAVLGSEHDGWFWDTEVVARAVLGGLVVEEIPVLFRRGRKRSTVRLGPDSYRQLLALHHFRAKVGMSLTAKSPVYWSAAGYDRAMDALCGPYDEKILADVVRRIPDGSSVVDVCGGTGRLAPLLRRKRCSYIGLDFNGAFVRSARRRGIDARLFDLLRDPIPRADYVVLCSSFYHFHEHAPEILGKLTAAARTAVIVSEPVVALGGSLMPRVLRDRLTQPGIGDASYRYDLPSFKALAQANGAALVSFREGDHNAIAVFPGRASVSETLSRPRRGSADEKVG